jgi:hypothetical protein
MSTAPSLPTQHAPAERESEQTIRQQANYFSGLIVLRQMLDAMPEPSAVLNKNRQASYLQSVAAGLQCQRSPLCSWPATRRAAGLHPRR